MPSICPSCTAYMLLIDDVRLEKGWVKCPTCGWCQDKDGNNQYTKELDKLDISKEERQERITYWRFNRKKD